MVGFSIIYNGSFHTEFHKELDELEKWDSI